MLILSFLLSPGLVVEHSQTVNLWCSELCALDCVYRELVPQLWSNAHTKTILTAACTPPKVGRKQPECSGHASIVMEVSWFLFCFLLLFIHLLFAYLSNVRKLEFYI